MKESELVAVILELGMRLGFMACHFRPALTNKGWRTAVQGDVGFPDIVLAKYGRVIVAECKSKVGRVTKEQEAWLLRLVSVANEAYVWRPEDWLSGKIEKVLRGK